MIEDTPKIVWDRIDKNATDVWFEDDAALKRFVKEPETILQTLDLYLEKDRQLSAIEPMKQRLKDELLLWENRQYNIDKVKGMMRDWLVAAIPITTSGNYTVGPWTIVAIAKLFVTVDRPELVPMKFWRNQNPCMELLYKEIHTFGRSVPGCRGEKGFDIQVILPHMDFTGPLKQLGE